MSYWRVERVDRERGWGGDGVYNNTRVCMCVVRSKKKEKRKRRGWGRGKSTDGIYADACCYCFVVVVIYIKCSQLNASPLYNAEGLGKRTREQKKKKKAGKKKREVGETKRAAVPASLGVANFHCKQG